MIILAVTNEVIIKMYIEAVASQNEQCKPNALLGQTICYNVPRLYGTDSRQWQSVTINVPSAKHSGAFINIEYLLCGVHLLIRMRTL